MILKIQDQTLKYDNEKINLNELDWSYLYRNNNLQLIQNIKEIQKIPYDWDFLDKNIDINKFKKQEFNSENYWFEIKENIIEFLELKNWNGLTVCKKSFIRSKDFKKNSDFYNVILKEKIENEKMFLNNFIFLEFLRNKENVILQVFENKKELEMLISNKDILRNVLLFDEKIILENVNINKTYVEKIIESSSIPQLSKVINKLTEEFKDTILSHKILNKISNVDMTLLSPKQLEFVLNEKKERELIQEDWIKVIGEIASSGIREKIKKFSKQKKKELKITKEFKKWLDINIGHQKKNFKFLSKEIQKKELNRANQILSITRKAIDKEVK